LCCHPTVANAESRWEGVTAGLYNRGVTTAEIRDGQAGAGAGSAGAAAAPSAAAFARQMVLRADGERPGRYHVALDPRWNCPTVPQGGTMAALAAAAMTAAVDDADQRLRTLTTVFAAPVPAGPVVLDTTLLRRGRSMSQATVTTHAPDDEAGHTSVAVFGRDRGGFEFTDLAMPPVPPPAECPSFRDPWPEDAGAPPDDRQPLAFWENVEGRAAIGHAPWDHYVPETSECAYWYRFDEPPMRPDGTLDPLAIIALCDLMPSSVGGYS
jgi:Acyl-CoA thioesterase N-terminal domain